MNSLKVIFLSCQAGYKMGTTHFNFKKHEKDKDNMESACKERSFPGRL